MCILFRGTVLRGLIDLRARKRFQNGLLYTHNSWPCLWERIGVPEMFEKHVYDTFRNYLAICIWGDIHGGVEIQKVIEIRCYGNTEVQKSMGWWCLFVVQRQTNTKKNTWSWRWYLRCRHNDGIHQHGVTSGLTWQIVLTRWAETKWLSFCWRHFQSHFLGWQSFYF